MMSLFINCNQQNTHIWNTITLCFIVIVGHADFHLRKVKWVIAVLVNTKSIEKHVICSNCDRPKEGSCQENTCCKKFVCCECGIFLRGRQYESSHTKHSHYLCYSCKDSHYPDDCHIFTNEQQYVCNNERIEDNNLTINLFK